MACASGGTFDTVGILCIPLNFFTSPMTALSSFLLACTSGIGVAGSQQRIACISALFFLCFANYSQGYKVDFARICQPD